MEKKEEVRGLSARIPSSIHEALRIAAFERRTTKTELVTAALTKELKQELAALRG